MMCSRKYSSVIAAGERKSSVRLEAGEGYGRWKGFEPEGGLMLQVGG